MATVVSWNGSNFTVPATGEENWGGATKVDGLLISLAQNSLQKSGGLFTLSADVDFGGTAGLKALYYKTHASNPASTGVVRLANTDLVCWRDFANASDLELGVDTSDNLTFNGHIISGSAGIVPVAAGGTGISSYAIGDTLYASGTTTLSKLTIGTVGKVLVSTGTAPSWALLLNANIDPAAAIAYSKLSLAASIVDADVAAAAAIARTKLASGTNYRILANSSSGVMSENAALTSGRVVIVDSNGQLADEAALSAARGGTGVANNAAATLTRVGNFALTLTLSGISSLTLPTSGTLATLAGTETLSNKSFSDQVTLAEVSTPSTPSSGFGKIYFKSDGFLYQLNDDGTETKVGAGAGGVNYITNGDAESNTTGWATYADAAGTDPVDGTGGSPTATWTRVTSSPLRGTGMFRLTKDAANRQGQGASYAFSIANADLGQPLNISFEYLPSSAFVAGTSASVRSDVTIWVYDVTNAGLIPVSPFVLPGGSGAKQKFSGTFQSASNSSSYRLIFHIGSTNASAWTLDIDDIVVGPQILMYGAPITDWVTFTPTGSWSANSTYTGKWRRVGSHMELQIRVSLSGAPTSASLTFNPPAGFTIDTSALVDATGGLVYGGVNMVCAGNQYVGGAVGNSVSGGIRIQNINSSIGRAADVTQASPATFANNDFVEFYGSVPIVGWGSNVVMSQDASTRVVAASAGGSGGTAGSGTPIIFGTVYFDTHGSYNSSTGEFTAPVSGYYMLHGTLDTSTASSVGIYAYVNGAQGLLVGNTTGFSAASANCQYTGIVKLTAGDKLTLSTTAGSLTVTDGAININRLSGPATIAASETVAARATLTISQLAITDKIIPFDSVASNTHGSYNSSTGVFTAPIAGFYTINAAALIGDVTSSTNCTVSIRLNGTIIKQA